MRLFLDTEFTCLARTQLISIGIVSECDKEFYRELTDTWTLAGCTLFVLGRVLPLLSEGVTGNRLYASLQSHLDLIQYELDAESHLPKLKKEDLHKQLETDMRLMDHLRFLTNQEVSDLYVMEDPFLKTPLRGLRPTSILAGEQVQTKAQASYDLDTWIKSFPEKPTICVDSFYDKELFQTLIDRPLPFERIPNLSSHFRLNLHHALDDAKALRSGWLEEGS